MGEKNLYVVNEWEWNLLENTNFYKYKRGKNIGIYLFKIRRKLAKTAGQNP
jgi:hypothetical protein